MPAKTGGSHAIASFVTLIVGTMFSKYLWDIAPPIGQLSLTVISTVRELSGAAIPVNEQFAGQVVIMVGLSFAWGILYHLNRH